MSNVTGWLSWLVTARPYITLIILLIVTVVLAAGAGLRAPPTEGANLAYLPPGNAVRTAAEEIDRYFGDSSDVSTVTVIFRGDAITPEGLAQMDALANEVANDPMVSELLVPGDAIVAPSTMAKGVALASGSETITQPVIDAARAIPEIDGAIDAMTGIDTDGTQIAIAEIRMRNTGDETIKNAERRIHELATESQGPLKVRSVSPTIVEDEYKEATESGMGPLIGLALVLIAVLLLVFTRTFSDMLLTLTGLIVSIVWIVGIEGWLGPNGLSVIGPPSSLSVMVPVIVISLTVDYAIQAISHYREQRLGGAEVVPAMRRGLSIVMVPLTLAAVTTIVSFLATLFSPIGVIADFGVVAGLGVGLSLIVMLTLVPAGRTIIDRRREARGRLPEPRAISNALPGITPLAELIGKAVTRWPAPFLGAILVVTIVLGIAATDLKSEFSIKDILPRGGGVLEDLNTLEAAVGGSTEMVNLLVRAEATEARSLLNLRDLTIGFEDETRRPRAAAGPLRASYEAIVRDWTHDSGVPGDNYDPELLALLQEATAGIELDSALMQEFLDRLEAINPAVTNLLVNNPHGPEAMLIQFPAYTHDPGATQDLEEEIEALWFGEDDNVTAVSESVIAVEVVNQITERQTEAISTTIAAALGILAVFFWLTLRQPALGVVAVGPIVLVLICVLGTMALLDIPYSLITSVITALSIGIGVDYTIHVIHRYREEFAHHRNPEQAAIRTLTTTGSALLGSAMTTALGFGVLIASPLVASQQFGITATITIVYSLAVAILVVLPAMVVWGAYQNMRLRSMVQRQWDELDEAIEMMEQDQHHQSDAA